jgi:hypothetical protein
MSRIIDVIGEANAPDLIYCLLSAYLESSVDARARSIKALHIGLVVAGAPQAITERAELTSL